MFASTRNRGFHIGFDNGWVVSVQFGPTNYCDHSASNIDPDQPMKERKWTCENAELLAWNDINPDMDETYMTDPLAYLTADQVAAQIAFYRNLPTPVFFGS